MVTVLVSAHGLDRNEQFYLHSKLITLTIFKYSTHSCFPIKLFFSKSASYDTITNIIYSVYITVLLFVELELEREKNVNLLRNFSAWGYMAIRRKYWMLETWFIWTGSSVCSRRTSFQTLFLISLKFGVL